MAKKKKKEEEPKEGEEKKKGGKLKWIIIGVIVLGLLGGGGFFAYKYFLAPKKKQEDVNASSEQPSESKEEQAKDGQKQGPTEIYSLPSFIVNLADPLGRRYLKIGIDVELLNKKVVAELEKKMPEIKDAIILLLSSKTYSQISTVEGKLALKQEIVARLTQILGKGKVINVYFTEFVVQ